MIRRSLIAFAASLPMSGAAFAHTGVGDVNGFVQGFAHPLGGIDHVLAMVAVGLFAAHLRGRALWLVPAAFVAMMAVGGGLGMAGVGLPFAEAGIGLSVVALGLVVWSRADMAVAAAMALVGLFAIFHGHAHGAEMPQSASGLEYGAGFIAATAALHAVGVGLGTAAENIGGRHGRRALRAAGAIMAATGVAILVGYA